MSSCICCCHNSLIREKADHIESACPKCVSSAVKECTDTEHSVKEKLLRLVRYDECLKEILNVRDGEGDLAAKLKKVFDLVEASLVPTVLCVNCKGLTVKSPCEHCGSSLI